MKIQYFKNILEHGNNVDFRSHSDLKKKTLFYNSCGILVFLSNDGEHVCLWDVLGWCRSCLRQVEKDQNLKVKVKMRDGAPPKSDKDLLAEWQEYFSSLLNNDNGQAPSDLPQPAAQDLPIHDHPPTLEDTLEAIRQMKTNKAAGLDCAVTAEALQGGGDAMADVIHCFCAEVYSNLTPPDQWITSVIVPVPKKGGLSLMTNYRGISLLSIAAKVYNKILLNRIRD